MNKLLVALICISFLFSCEGQKKEEDKNRQPKDVMEKSINANAYSVNVLKSEVSWIGYKPGDEMNGTIKLKNGSINVINGKIEGGSFEMDLSTILATDSDLGEKGNADLTAHLKSDDFFNVAVHPTAKFEITKLTELSNSEMGTHLVYGNLTLNETTKSVDFPSNINCINNICTITAEFNMDRTNWGMEFMSKKLLGEIADRFIKDEITIGLNVVAGK